MSRLDTVRDRQIALVRKAQLRAINTMLPDICTIRPSTGQTRTVNNKGISVIVPSPLREYDGSTGIPCRADPSRSFRPDDLEYQSSQVDEIDLQLPFDLTVEEEDVVTLRGHEYKIRKLADDSNYDLTKVAKIMRNL
jgi:hypothetical protein